MLFSLESDSAQCYPTQSFHVNLFFDSALYDIVQSLLFYEYLCENEIRRCSGLVVNIHASRLPVPGLNLGSEPPHSVV